MKRITLSMLLFVLAVGAGSLKAQYKTAVGIRGAWGPGITVKHHLTSERAVEAILSARRRGVIVTGLYEVHFPALGVTNLRWYLGGGGHIGFWSLKNTDISWLDTDGGIVIGADGIGGLEYTLENIPLNFSLDWKPGFNLVGHNGFWLDDGALSIRYAF